MTSSVASTVFGKIGFRFQTEIERADPALIAELQSTPLPTSPTQCTASA